MRHEESRMQAACKQWFDYQFQPLKSMLFAVPNGGQRGKREASIMKAEGVVAGVSDMILLVARNGYGALCIEFKTEKGRQSINQKMWQQETEKHGNKYVVVRSFYEFVKEITAYLA